MKNFITILILSLAIIGCQAPNADPNGRTLIDPTDLIAVADSFNDALNSGDVEAASAMLADDVSWGFPNGVNIEGKDAVTQMLTVTTQIWTTIDQQSGETNYLGVTGGEQGEEWTALLSWGQATYANEANSVSVPYHQVTWFTEDNLIGAIYGLYDRTELVASYDEDPIK
jgi:hypothetical protein|tara:strand:+ start:819 stop:1328 length:510 start_codon:yes stop_codon:yes gene_type:complete